MIPQHIFDEPTHCEECGEPIEWDEGGAYHVESGSYDCSPEGINQVKEGA